MPIGPDPRGCTLQPLAVAIACVVGAGGWLFSFKLLAAACRAVGGMTGAGQ